MHEPLVPSGAGDLLAPASTCNRSLRGKKIQQNQVNQVHLAEEVGFEPTVRFHARRFSRPVHSTTLPLLQPGLAIGRRVILKAPSATPPEILECPFHAEERWLSINGISGKSQTRKLRAGCAA